MTPDEIRAWWDDPVADFFKHILARAVRDSTDAMRGHIAKQEFHDAVSYNAGIDVYVEMLGMKDQMIEEVLDDDYVKEGGE